MKTYNFYKIIALVFTTALLISCVQDDEFDVPQTQITAPNLEGNVLTIGSIKAALNQQINQAAADQGLDPGDFGYDAAIESLRQTEKLTFNAEQPSYTEGFVISNDESGNFFEEIIIQDTSANPTNGVRLLMDVSPLFTYAEFGRKVFIRLDGLTIAYSNGVLTLGVRDGNNLEKVPESQLTDFLIRDVEVAVIEPKQLSFDAFNDDNVNLYIQLTQTQFSFNDAVGDNRKTFASEPEDEFDGERTLENCETGQTVIFSTSTFADFKSVLLPQGRGSLDGILTKNFFGDAFNVVVNDPTAINFNEEERCDAPRFDCGIANATGPNVLFSDFFETQQTNTPISGNGWTNFVEAGTETWEAYSDNNSLGISARMGSFNSGDASSIGWLVTPAINFDAQEGETLNFRTSNSFSDGSEMEVLLSTDWDGVAENIPNATWNLLPAAFIVEDGDPFASFFPSGNVSLDCVTGTGYIAFKYTGSGNPDFDGTYELDEVEIESN